MAKKSIGGTKPEVSFPIAVPKNDTGYNPSKVGQNSMPKYENPPPPPPPRQED